MAIIEISSDLELDKTDSRFVEIDRNEPIDIKSTEQQLQRTGTQQEQQDPFQRQAQQPGFFQTGAISTGRGLARIGRALGLVEPETESEKKAFEALGEERPITTTIGEAVGESLPFAAVPVGAIAGTTGKILATAGLGALEGGLIAKGAGGTESEQIQAAGIGGTVAGGLEASLPHVLRLGGKLVRKFLKKAPSSTLLTPDGLPTDELNQALDSAGITFDDLKEAGQDLLVQQPPGAEPGEAIRKAALEGQGLVGEGAPTKAQITRQATDFQAQQEAAKTSGRVRTRLESQQGILVNKFDETIAGTGGEAVTSGAPVVDHVVNKSTQLDNEISDLYNIAKERLTDAENVDLSKTFARLKSMRPSDTTMGGIIKSLEGEASRLGLLDSETGVSRLATVDESELLRKFSNQLFDSTTNFGKTGLRNFRDAIDDDVTKSAGEDIFKAGRQAKAKFEADLSRSKINKFDKRKGSLVRDILENKISPDTFLADAVLAKKVRGEDLKALKSYLSTGTPEQIEAGTKAFNDLKAETLAHIKNKAFVGPEDAAGNKNLSRAALESVVNKIGPEKLGVLFDPVELSFIKDMQRVSKLLEPVRGTQQGKGPSAQAIDAMLQSLKRRIDKIPLLNVFVDLELGQAGTVLTGKPAVIDKLIPLKERVQRDITAALPLPAAAAVTAGLREEETK